MNRTSYWALVFTAVATVAANNSALAAQHEIKIITDYENMRMAFEPKTLTVARGDTVTWINQVDEHHNVLTYPDGFPVGSKPFSSPNLDKAGQRWSYTFDKAGTYEYHCIPHMMMGMRGNIIVDTPSLPSMMHIPRKKEVLAYRDRLLEYFESNEINKLPEYIKVEKRQR